MAMGIRLTTGNMQNVQAANQSPSHADLFFLNLSGPASVLTPNVPRLLLVVGAFTIYLYIFHSAPLFLG